MLDFLRAEDVVRDPYFVKILFLICNAVLLIYLNLFYGYVCR